MKALRRKERTARAWKAVKHLTERVSQIEQTLIRLLMTVQQLNQAMLTLDAVCSAMAGSILHGKDDEFAAILKEYLREDGGETTGEAVAGAEEAAVRERESIPEHSPGEPTLGEVA